MTEHELQKLFTMCARDLTKKYHEGITSGSRREDIIPRDLYITIIRTAINEVQQYLDEKYNQNGIEVHLEHEHLYSEHNTMDVHVLRVVHIQYDEIAYEVHKSKYQLLYFLNTKCTLYPSHVPTVYIRPRHLYVHKFSGMYSESTEVHLIRSYKAKKVLVPCTSAGFTNMTRNEYQYFMYCVVYVEGLHCNDIMDEDLRAYIHRSLFLAVIEYNEANQIIRKTYYQRGIEVQRTPHIEQYEKQKRKMKEFEWSMMGYE